MIFVFDLDDTLYSEYLFVQEGFLEVANFISSISSKDKKYIFNYLIMDFHRNGRGKNFNNTLSNLGVFSEEHLLECIRRYINFPRDLFLYNGVRDVLCTRLNSQSYLVTDGNPVAQKNKVRCLGIEKCFKKIFYTGELGPSYHKPSARAFSDIKRIEKCNWNDIVYIGDNPYKDFVGIKPYGINTVRVLNGAYRADRVPQEFEADTIIYDLQELVGEFL